MSRLGLLAGGGAAVAALAGARLATGAKASSTSGVAEVSVRDYGALGDGSSDDTAAIQSAIDAGQCDVSGGSCAPIVYFPPGEYVISQTIQWKSAHLVGVFPNNSVRLQWNGPAGGTMVQKWAESHPGNESFALLSGINFCHGSAEPGTFVDLTTNDNGVDKFGIIERCHFADCTGDAIKVGGWVNGHWTDLRFDAIGGFAIRLTADPSQSYSSFVLDRFTYDHSRSSNPGEGVLLVDASACGAQGIGTVRLSNGRIEVNQPWSGRKAIVVVMPGSGATGSVDMHVSDVAYADSTGMPDDVLLYRDSSNSQGSETLELTNVSTNGLSAILGGVWPSVTPALPPGTYGRLTFNHKDPNNVANSIDIRSLAWPTSYALQIRQGADTFPRVRVDANGTLNFGSGSAAPDANLYRAGAGILKTDGALIASGGLVVKAKSGAPTSADSASAQDGMMYVDTQGSKLYVRLGGKWKSVKLS